MKVPLEPIDTDYQDKAIDRKESLVVNLFS